jgi:hypothetical protein
MAKRNASARAIGPRTWAASSGVPGPAVEASATRRPAGLVLRPAVGAVLPEAGLGAGAGVISGKRLAAFPALMRVVLTAFRPGTGPGTAVGAMAVKRLALFGLGSGTGGRFVPGRDVPAEPAEPFGDALADGLGDAERVVLALAVGATERVAVALGVGRPDAEPVGLALGVGAGDVEMVGLGVGVGAGADVDGEGEGDADVDGDGLGVLEALGPELVLAAAGEGEGEEVTTLASAESWALTDSPETRKPPATRLATTARRCARDIWTPLPLLRVRVGT